jgi:hypothetical protein
MKTARFTYWQDGSCYLGFLNDYPDRQTEADSGREHIPQADPSLRSG